MKKSLIIISFSTILSLTSHGAEVFAGRVDVVNENKKALTIKIQAEGDSLGERLATYAQKIPAEHYSIFRVDVKDLKGKSYFSIKGNTSSFTVGDTCQHLNVNKDYQVTFVNDSVGTTCLAEEVK